MDWVDGYHQVCLDLNLKIISDVQSLPKEFLRLPGQERGELITPARREEIIEK